MHGPKLIVGAEVRRLAGRQLDAEKRRHGAARRGSAVVLPVVPYKQKRTSASGAGVNVVGVQRVGWLIRFHLLRPLGRLYGSMYYWMLPPIPTARRSLARLRGGHRLLRPAPLVPPGEVVSLKVEKKDFGSDERVAGKGSGDGANARSCVLYRDVVYAPAPSRSRCGTRAGCSSSAALSRRTA
jgi:hypothetical protein